jgi:hypothetical protein
MEYFWVRPKEPTILANHQFHELLPTDLLISLVVGCSLEASVPGIRLTMLQANTVHVVPGPIDVERFNDALSCTLSVYPLATGRIEKPSSSDLPWKVLIESSVSQIYSELL